MSTPLPERQLWKFDFKQVATALVKEKGLRTGIWAVYIEFGLGAGNLHDSERRLLPTAFVPVVRIGIREAEVIDDLSVDAAVVNPESTQPSQKKVRGRKTSAVIA